MKRTVFFISDSTAITVQTLGQSLLTQFEQFEFEKIMIPFINTPEKAYQTVARINASTDERPIVLITLLDQELSAIILTSKGWALDFFQPFLGPLEAELQSSSSHRIGVSHGMVNYESYKNRIDTINFALANDDGMNINFFDRAEIILIGVSRTGKTPTCLFLAIQFGVYAANYPFTEDDCGTWRLPDFLQVHKKKLFGLTIETERLQAIRSERKANSRYASLEQCEKENRNMQNLLARENIPYIDTTTRSIEEIASSILAISGIARRG